jgi:hypothetical protein
VGRDEEGANEAAGRIENVELMAQLLSASMKCVDNENESIKQLPRTLGRGEKHTKRL